VSGAPRARAPPQVGEMTQALYAHMNNKRKKLIKKIKIK
jgi:hypothetical protein